MTIGGMEISHMFIVVGVVLLMIVGLGLVASLRSGHLSQYLIRLFGNLFSGEINLPKPIAFLVSKISSVFSYSPWVLFGRSIFDSAFAPVVAEMGDSYKARFKNDSNPFLRDDLDGSREYRWPKARYEELYIDTPADVNHRIIEDGRLLDGSMPATELTPGFISDEFIKSTAEIAYKDGLARYKVFSTLFSFIGLTIGALIALWSFVSLYAYNANASTQEVVDHDFLYEPSVLSGVASGIGNAFSYAFSVVPGIAAGLALAFIWSLVPIIGSIYSAQRLQRIRVFQKAEHAVAYHLRGSDWESIVRWKGRQEQREFERKARLNQYKAVAKGGWDSEEPITLGKATGTFEFRGSLNAPTADQVMALSPKALEQHILVMGQSGTGKTSRILKPLFEHCVTSIKNGHLNASVFLTDGKGTLYEDLIPIAQKEGFRTVIIGTAPGSVGMDLTATVKPQMFADLIRSVAEQADGGGGGDAYWVSMASHYIYISAKLLEAWQRTDQGIAWSKDNGSKPYSPQNILKLATEIAGPDGWGWQIIEDITSSPKFRDSDKYAEAQDLIEESLYAAMHFYMNDWRNLAEATRTGIQSNVTKLLYGFVADESLRRNFGSGKNTDFDLRELYAADPIVVGTSLSATDSFAHRLTLILIKSMLYLEAFRYNRENKDMRGQRQISFYGDEFQDIITKDLKSISDATAINKLRGSVILTIATQTLNALEQAIGDVSSRNFIDQFSTVISFRQRDEKTIRMLQLMAGKGLRQNVYDKDDYESYVARKTETGINVLSDVVYLAPLNVDAHVPTGRFSTEVGYFPDKPYSFIGEIKKYSPEMYHKFLPSKGTVAQPNSNLTAYLSALQAAEFRAEDKNLDLLKGAREEMVLRDEDMQNLGSSQAVAFWVRGGHLRMDIVEFDDRRNT